MALEEEIRRKGARETGAGQTCAGVGRGLVPRRQDAALGSRPLAMRAMAVELPEVLGQPGRLNQLEGRVGLAEESIQKIKGVVAAAGMGLTLIQIAIGFLNAHRH